MRKNLTRSVPKYDTLLTSGQRNIFDQHGYGTVASSSYDYGSVSTTAVTISGTACTLALLLISDTASAEYVSIKVNENMSGKAKTGLKMKHLNSGVTKSLDGTSAAAWAVAGSYYEQRWTGTTTFTDWMIDGDDYEVTFY